MDYILRIILIHYIYINYTDTPYTNIYIYIHTYVYIQVYTYRYHTLYISFFNADLQMEPPGGEARRARAALRAAGLP